MRAIAAVSFALLVVAACEASKNSAAPDLTPKAAKAPGTQASATAMGGKEEKKRNEDDSDEGDEPHAVSGASGSGGIETSGQRSVKLIETGSDVQGRLAPEVVKRIVQANFPRLRGCYEDGLKTEPSLNGTVSVRFVIDASGGVETASIAGGSLTNPAVRGCLIGIYRSMSFPHPDSGKVTVTYPIDFEIDR